MMELERVCMENIKNLYSYCEHSLGEIQKGNIRICFICDDFKNTLFSEEGKDERTMTTYMAYVEAKYQASVKYMVPPKEYNGKRYCAIAC